jgi:phosphate transport system permease protein
MASAIATVAAEQRENLRGDRARSRRIVDNIATGVLWSAAAFVVLLLAFFIVYLFVRGASTISWHFLTGFPSSSDAGGGIGPEIFNSF